MSGGNNGKVLTVSRKLAKILKAITPLRPSNEGLGLCFLFSRFCCNYLHFYLIFFPFSFCSSWRLVQVEQLDRV